MSVRILLINANTDPAMTALIARHAAAAVSGVELVAVTARFGARYIASRAAAAVAGHAALDAFAEHGAGCDAALLACFGDPGLFALKEISPIPAVGLAEAAFNEAQAGGRRYAVVTGGAAWEPMLAELVAALDLTGHCAAIRTVAPTGAAIARDPEHALSLLIDACEACATCDGADVVILGGAGLAGLAPRIASQVRVPIICSVEAGVRAAATAARSFRGGRTSVAPIKLGIETIGLSGTLAKLMGEGEAEPAPVAVVGARGAAR